MSFVRYSIVNIYFTKNVSLYMFVKHTCLIVKFSAIFNPCNICHTYNQICIPSCISISYVVVEYLQSKRVFSHSDQTFELCLETKERS